MNNYGTNTNPYSQNPYMGQQNSYAPNTAYSNPYGMSSAMINGATQQQMNMNQQQNDAVNYVSKEDYDKLLLEKRKLQEQLESELAQRVDIEFYKKEQEMVRLPEGQRIAQELEYQKSQFFEAFWRTSESGKNAMKKYRESIGSLYDRYSMGDMIPPVQQPQKQVNAEPINTAPQPVTEEQVF